MPLELALAIVPLLIAMNAFFVVGEYTVVALRPAQVQNLITRGRRRTVEAITQLKADPSSSIGAIQVCITMTNLLLGWIGEPAMTAVLIATLGRVIPLSPQVTTPISIALAFIVVTFLTVVFSELLPKAMTLRYLEPAAMLTAVPVLAIRRAIFPLVWLMNQTANLVTKPLGLGSVEDFEESHVTPDELRLLAIQAAEDGLVTPRERSLVLNALTIGKRKANEVMVPRVHVDFVDLQKSMDENDIVVERSLRSRLPLCDGGMDKVVGVVLTREFLAAKLAGGETQVLSLIARPPVFVPERATLDQLIRTFDEERTQMVFLVDEYGGVEGIVTLRDVLRELLRDTEGLAAPSAETPEAASG